MPKQRSQSNALRGFQVRPDPLASARRLAQLFRRGQHKAAAALIQERASADRELARRDAVAVGAKEEAG